MQNLDTDCCSPVQQSSRGTCSISFQSMKSISLYFTYGAGVTELRRKTPSGEIGSSKRSSQHYGRRAEQREGGSVGPQLLFIASLLTP